MWFAFDELRPLTCFAGLWTRWTSVRKVREGETTNDLYAFLTINPNAEVSAIHPKAMPVILRTLEEMDIWMTAPAADALKLQRPLPDGTLRVVATGAKTDEPLVACHVSIIGRDSHHPPMSFASATQRTVAMPSLQRPPQYFADQPPGGRPCRP